MGGFPSRDLEHYRLEGRKGGVETPGASAWAPIGVRNRRNAIAKEHRTTIERRNNVPRRCQPTARSVGTSRYGVKVPCRAQVQAIVRAPPGAARLSRRPWAEPLTCLPNVRCERCARIDTNTCEEGGRDARHDDRAGWLLPDDPANRLTARTEPRARDSPASSLVLRSCRYAPFDRLCSTLAPGATGGAGEASAKQELRGCDLSPYVL